MSQYGFFYNVIVRKKKKSRPIFQIPAATNSTNQGLTRCPGVYRAITGTATCTLALSMSVLEVDYL